MQTKLKTLAIIIAFLSIYLIAKSTIFAQVNSSGFAISIPLSESDIQDGDIICSYEDGFTRCIGEYDPGMYGVVSKNASVILEDSELENTQPVLTSGVVSLRVNSSGGNIEEGDFVTSSENIGIGKKATRNGYVLGVAMEAFSSQSQTDVGSIQVTLNIHPASGLTGPGSNLLQFIRKGLAVPIFEPLESLRYILAVLMVIISFALGMIYFGRSSRTGIEAIGRNPLAKKVIQLTVLLNIVLTIVIVLVGLGIAYLILIL